MTGFTRNELFKQLLPALEKEFDIQYARITYTMKPLYGKYAIFKTEGTVSTTLAKGLDKTTAEGMMKLLEEPQ